MAERLRLWPAGLLAFFASGCSLVSGWSDLQGGSLPLADGGAPGGDATVSGSTQDAAPEADAAAIDSSSTTGFDAGAGKDAAPPVDAAPNLSEVECGGVRCASGEGCCSKLLNGGATCQTAAVGCSTPSVFATCSDSSQCSGAAQCCQASQGATITCQANCGGTIVCDLTLAKPGCAAGTTCQVNADGWAFDTCN